MRGNLTFILFVPIEIHIDHSFKPRILPQEASTVLPSGST